MTFAGGAPPRGGRIGPDGVPRRFPGEDGATAGMREAGLSDGELRAEHDGIAQIDAFGLRLRLYGDRLETDAKDRTCEQGVTLEGRLT